jgi:hypothetical protein
MVNYENLMRLVLQKFPTLTREEAKTLIRDTPIAILDKILDEEHL